MYNTHANASQCKIKENRREEQSGQRTCIHTYTQIWRRALVYAWAHTKATVMAVFTFPTLFKFTHVCTTGDTVFYLHLIAVDVRVRRRW
mmetsp:Transcript_10978/g.28827  ORF Transcript_10978/g.28827 Transcript_10978/m.28827 type:complete len:89 (-) Transcript_10978:963-1229(-)